MKTVSGLFDNYDDAANAVGELEATGIPRSDISIVASNSDKRHDNDRSDAGEDAAEGAGIGAVVGGAGGLLTGLGIMAIPGVGPVVAAGWLEDPLIPEAERVLGQSTAVDVAARRRDYESGGWTGFDPDAGAYSSDEIDRDRLRDSNRP